MTPPLQVYMIIPTKAQTTKETSYWKYCFILNNAKHNQSYFCHVPPAGSLHSSFKPRQLRRPIADILTALYRCQEALYQPTSHCCEIIYHSKLTVKLHFISPRRQTLSHPPSFSPSLSPPPLTPPPIFSSRAAPCPRK